MGSFVVSPTGSTVGSQVAQTDPVYLGIVIGEGVKGREGESMRPYELAHILHALEVADPRLRWLFDVVSNAIGVDAALFTLKINVAQLPTPAELRALARAKWKKEREEQYQKRIEMRQQRSR